MNKLTENIKYYLDVILGMENTAEMVREERIVDLIESNSSAEFHSGIIGYILEWYESGDMNCEIVWDKSELPLLSVGINKELSSDWGISFQEEFFVARKKFASAEEMAKIVLHIMNRNYSNHERRIAVISYLLFSGLCLYVKWRRCITEEGDSLFGA